MNCCCSCSFGCSCSFRDVVVVVVVVVDGGAAGINSLGSVSRMENTDRLFCVVGALAAGGDWEGRFFSILISAQFYIIA